MVINKTQIQCSSRFSIFKNYIPNSYSCHLTCNLYLGIGGAPRLFAFWHLTKVKSQMCHPKYNNLSKLWVIPCCSLVAGIARVMSNQAGLLTWTGYQQSWGLLWVATVWVFSTEQVWSLRAYRLHCIVELSYSRLSYREICAVVWQSENTDMATVISRVSCSVHIPRDRLLHIQEMEKHFGWKSGSMKVWRHLFMQSKIWWNNDGSQQWR